MENRGHIIVTKVLLTDTEVEICKIIGKIRNIKTSALCAEQIQSNKDPIQISIDGVLSEYMIAKHKGWFFDLNCEVRKFGADLIAPTGHKIDVKSTRRINGDMNVRITHATKNYDFYVLVELDANDNGTIVGIASREVVIDDENKKVSNLTNQEYYCVPRSKLKEWK
jgi:hypothetical protein